MEEEDEEREALKWLKPHTQDPVEDDRKGRDGRGGGGEESVEQGVTPLRGEEKERGETSSSSYEFSKDSIES